MADSEDSGAEIVARRVLLTGGTSGLGLAMASALAHAGASVVLTGRDAGRAEQVAATLPGASGLGLDTRDEASVSAAVQAAAGRWVASTCWSTTPGWACARSTRGS